MVDLEFLLARRKINVSDWLSEKGVSDKTSLLAAIKDVGAAVPSETKILELLGKVKVPDFVMSDEAKILHAVMRRFHFKENENKDAIDVLNVVCGVKRKENGYILDMMDGFGVLVEQVELDSNEQVVSRTSLPVKTVERKVRKSKVVDETKTEE